MTRLLEARPTTIGSAPEKTPLALPEPAASEVTFGWEHHGNQGDRFGFAIWLGGVVLMAALLTYDLVTCWLSRPRP